MPRSRPASNPLSFHKPTGQYYITRAGKRVYLGADRPMAIQNYHRLALGVAIDPDGPPEVVPALTARQLANRFLATQQANWRDPKVTLTGYRNWLARFLADHRGLQAAEFTVEAFAAWKLSLRQRGYAPVSINHYLKSVRAMYAFAEDSGLLEEVPNLRRIKNERISPAQASERPLYESTEVSALLAKADPHLAAMILLALNCGFGPKDISDLLWRHVEDDRVTLARTKTGICQTFRLWPETRNALDAVFAHREQLIARLAKRDRQRSDEGRVFVTKYWRPWSKDAVAEQFRKLCKKVGVPCYGFYRLRHCASTAMSLVATPHVQRRFMRHSQLQQQVTYTHVPDDEVDAALLRARDRLLGEATEGQESDPQPTASARRCGETAGPG